MSDRPEVTFQLNFQTRRRRRTTAEPGGADQQPVSVSIPRIARLMALAIRIEGLVREQAIADYAEVSRRGRITRARMTQILQLLHLAPDIQEQILFSPPLPRLNERNLRPIVAPIDWQAQRLLFQQLQCRG
jgi:hypothetical protein